MKGAVGAEISRVRRLVTRGIASLRHGEKPLDRLRRRAFGGERGAAALHDASELAQFLVAGHCDRSHREAAIGLHLDQALERQSVEGFAQGSPRHLHLLA